MITCEMIHIALLANIVKMFYNLRRGVDDVLAENLKKLRTAKGFTQDELSIRLNVVRQTISKWEKGLTVPDAETLIKISDIFEVSVSELLGTIDECEDKNNPIVDQLSRINEHLARKRRIAKRIWIAILVVLLVFILLNLVSLFLFLTPPTVSGGGAGGEVVLI